MSASEPETPKPNAVDQEVTNALDNLKAENEKLRGELAEARSQLATLAADREDLAQLKKQVKEDAAELHREENCMKLEKARWQRELGDARDELKDAQATILKQGNKIRELERGYSLKPNPAESRLRLEIGDLQAELEAYKQQNPAPAIELPEPADLLNQLKGRRKKSKADLADVEVLLDLFCDGCDL